MKFNCFQCIGVGNVPANEFAISLYCVDNLGIAVIVPLAQVIIVEKPQCVPLHPESANRVAALHWSQHRRDQYGVGIRLPVLQQRRGEHGETVTVVFLPVPDRLRIADGIIQVQGTVHGPRHCTKIVLNLLR